jgi:NAD(P)-dependent dehydrogenase (short-subunit alcohol dehydrogenase family)
LAQEGVQKIAIHYLSRQDEAEKTLTLISDAGAEGVLVQGDTSDANRAEAIVHEAAEKLGGCDIFVHSVIPRLEEIYEHTLATDVSLVKWQLAYDTQARAFFIGARAAAKYDAWGPDPGIVVHTWRTNRRLATLGRHGSGQGGARKHLQILRRGFRAAGDYGKCGQPWRQ